MLLRGTKIFFQKLFVVSVSLLLLYSLSALVELN